MPANVKGVDAKRIGPVSNSSNRIDVFTALTNVRPRAWKVNGPAQLPKERRPQAINRQQTKGTTNMGLTIRDSPKGARQRYPSHPGNTTRSRCLQQGEYRWVMHDPLRHRPTIRANPSLALGFACGAKPRQKCQIKETAREKQSPDETPD